MKLLISLIVMLSLLLAVVAAVQVRKVAARVCPACGASGGEPDQDGDPSLPAQSGDVTLFAFLAKDPVNPCWCRACGNKWRIVRG